MKQAQSGRSMLEMLGVLVIIGILSAAGLAGYSKLIMQHKIGLTLEQIGMISAKISSVGYSTSSYGGLTNQGAIKLGAVPSELIASASGTLKNAFDGNVTIAPSNLVQNGSDNQAYTITFSGLPDEACIAIASVDWNNSINATLLGVSAGTSSGAASIYQDCPGSSGSPAVACSKGTTVGMPMDLNLARDACSCSSANNCMVVFKYY